MIAMMLLFLAPQNIVEGDGWGRTAEPIRIDDTQFEETIAAYPSSAFREDPESLRVRRKLSAHIEEFLAGYPYKAFQNTLGISAYETYFNHPDRMYYALSVSLPWLMRPEGEKVRDFLKEQLARTPPYAVDGFENKAGAPREAFEVPETLRLGGRGKAASAVGVYAFWCYTHHCGDVDARKSHWEALKARMQPLLAQDYAFDLKKNHANDEAQKLNGDLAGLIALIHLARSNADAETEKQAKARARTLLEFRVNLERTNARILEKTNSSSAHLHASKLARYCDLVSPVAEAVRRLSDGCAAERLKAFREARNGWPLAFGDRLIGGENYTNPPHFVHALWAGVVTIERLEGAKVLSFVDVPWCKGDFYFMEQCAGALWAASGRGWTQIPR